MTETQTVDLSNHEDNTISKLWGKITPEETELRDLHKEILASSPPSLFEVDRILRESDDPEVKGRMNAVAEAEKALEAAKTEAREYVLSGFDSVPEEELKAKRARFSTLYGKVKTLLGLVSDVSETLGYEGVKESVATYEKSLPTLRGVGNFGGSRGGNTGHRPKIESIEVTKPGKDTKAYNKLSQASIYSKVDTADIYSAWLKEADETEWKNVTETVSFVVNDIEFTIVPKTTDAENETEDASDEETE